MRFSLRRIDAGTPALAELQALHVRCATFVEETTGHSPRDDEAARLLAILPPGMNLADKEALGLHRDGEMVGAQAFWRRHGFEPIDSRIQELGTRKNLVFKMVRPL